MTTLTIGTRGSQLALWQTEHVAALLRKAEPSLEVKVKIITTRGDVDQSARLVGKLEKGFFTEELERELREGLIDTAVHSLKDLPTRMPKGLALGATLTREEPNDLLIIDPKWLHHVSEARLPLKDGARVGASSLRRDALLKKFAPGCAPVPLRGNVPTRIERLREGRTDAIVIAAAGVNRLQLDLKGLAVFRLNPLRWPPAPGQGAIGVQRRADDLVVAGLLGRLDHRETAEATGWERDFLRVLEGGCATPFGCYVEGGRAHLGQATASGWRSRQVTLPEGTSGDARSEFITRVLAEEMPGHGDGDGWLFSKV